MKKSLACILALVLMLSCGISAAAALPSEIDSQSLAFELPVVTGIEAVWNGEVVLDRWLDLFFNPDNVAITVSFEEGEPEVLGYWRANSSAWFWEVFHRYDSETNTVTFFYHDTNFRDAYLAENEIDILPVRWITELAEYRATLPQSSFVFPANYLELFVEAQKPLTALTLSETLTVLGDEDGLRVFTFSPAASGLFSISGAMLIVAGADFQVIYSGWSWNGLASLEAGKTYYIFHNTWQGIEGSVTVSQASVWQRVMSWLQGLQFELPVWVQTAIAAPFLVLILPALGYLLLILPFLPWLL